LVDGLLGQVVDVTLPTTTSTWTTAAAVLGTVAAASATTWVGWVLLRGWRQPAAATGGDLTADHTSAGPASTAGDATDLPAVDSDVQGMDRWGSALMAVAATTSMLALLTGIAGLVALDAVPGTAGALTHPTTILLGVRIIGLALAWLVARNRHVLGSREVAIAQVACAVVVGATVALGGARLQVDGWPLDVALAVAAMSIGGLSALALWIKRPDLRPMAWAVLVPITLAAVPSWLLVAPPTDTPVAAVAVEVDAGTLDVSVVPARPGSAAVHLYALDDDGLPVDVTGGTVVVEGSMPVALFRAGPNHLIGYGVDLPDTSQWQVSITTTGDLAATATTTLPRP